MNWPLRIVIFIVLFTIFSMALTQCGGDRSPRPQPVALIYQP